MVSFYKTRHRTKFFFYSLPIILLCLSLFIVNTRFNRISKDIIRTNVIKSSDTTTDKKFILLWTNLNKYPFFYFGKENTVFLNKSCKWINCYVTGDRNYLGGYSEFDVIAFNGPQLSTLLYMDDLPKERQYHQKYVYANIEAASNYPMFTNRLDGFFNWTWTYRLNSDAVWGYFVVKDANNNVVGPRENMRWLDVDKMDPIDDDLKTKLQSKNKAAAWFSSNCVTASRREEFVNMIKHHLKKYNLEIDVYGDCGDHQCPKTMMPRCLRLLKKRYYFYFAFENAFSEDYITEKIVYALNYDTIPVVYGGANYSRFLPGGVYLDAVKLGPSKLAQTMHEIMNDPARFHKFFRWKKYYSFHFKHEDPKTDVYCKFCEMINNRTLMHSHSAYENFTLWWMKNTKVDISRGK